MWSQARYAPGCNVVQRLCSTAALWCSGFVVQHFTLRGSFVAQRLCSTAASWYDTLRLLAQQFFAVQLRGTATWVQQRLCGTAALWRFRGTVALWYSGFVIQRLCTAAVSWYSGSVVQQFFVVHLRGKAACGSTGCLVQRLCGSATWWYDSFVAQRGT